METAKNTTNRQDIYSFIALLLLLGAATGIGYMFRHAGFPETNIVIIYILSVLVTAMLTHRYFLDIVASLAATFTYNFFFTEPYFSFSVNDPGYIITFVVMTITALITSTLTSRVRKNALIAKEKEAENTALVMERFKIAQEQQKAREETERERYRSNLLRAISHDLRTPLAGILGASKMLSDVAEDKEAVAAIAEDIYSEADWLHALVENILNLTRLQDGKLLPKKEPEAVEEIIGFAVAVISRRYPGTEISVAAPDDLLVIPMDARLISQVLINLLENAAKHSRDGVSITVAGEDGFVRFIISDEGPGISEEDLPNIFEMFYTADKPRPDARHGIGLGLTICKAIVNAHGGEITARNKAGGRGAEFIFTLPSEDLSENGNEE